MHNGGPAFPVEHNAHSRAAHEGMTLRDYFACHIVQAMLRPTIPLTMADFETAYHYATMMVTARQKEYQPV
jgi:hypothetical protein